MGGQSHVVEDHAGESASPWVARFASLIPRGGRVLDLACGTGRHARLLREFGLSVLAVDRDARALAGLSGLSGIQVLQADLESGPWPLKGEFDGIVVTHYLHRPLFDAIRRGLKPGGVLIYETFAVGNERFGRPSNPAFLLRRGELLELAEGLQVLAYEQGVISHPKRAVVQRICAVKNSEPVELPAKNQGA